MLVIVSMMIKTRQDYLNVLSGYGVKIGLKETFEDEEDIIDPDKIKIQVKSKPNKATPELIKEWKENVKKAKDKDKEREEKRAHIKKLDIKCPCGITIKYAGFRKHTLSIKHNTHILKVQSKTQNFSVEEYNKDILKKYKSK